MKSIVISVFVALLGEPVLAGTVGNLPKFRTSSAVTDSAVSESTSPATLTVNETLALPTYSSTTVPYIGVSGVVKSTGNLTFIEDDGNPGNPGNSFRVGGNGGAHGGEIACYGQGGVASTSWFADDTYGAMAIISDEKGNGNIFMEGFPGRISISTNASVSAIDRLILSQSETLGGTATFNDENGNTKLSLDGHGTIYLSTQTAAPAADPSRAVFFSTGGASAEMWVEDGAGNSTQISPHDPETGKWRFLSCHTSGRCYEVPDMERLVAIVEEMSGKKLHREWRNKP